jgi:methyltransferase (TIGR00027 family)
MAMTPVGFTSRWIAASRALETESANPLFIDPFARELAGEPGFATMTTMRAVIDVVVDPSVPDPYLSIRTKFLDDAMLAAVRESSITQAVILAAGMDARAFRLEWPAGVVLFEVDRDDVFDHKEPLLKQLHARPTCDRRIVRADLSKAWTDAIIHAGFDPTRPAAILVEGLLMYLEEPAVTQLFLALRTIACEGSWIGLDVVNTEMLVSPYLTAYLKKLKELGSPWTFGVRDPEKFLADHGWQGTVVLPGEAEANYGRWPYPVIPRTFPGIPRSYLVHAARTDAARATAISETAHEEPAPPRTTTYQPIHEPGLVGAFGCPDGEGPFPAVLALGGSDGGVPEFFLDLLVPEGVACLGLAYFGTDGTQPSLIDVPLERIERGLRWLAAHSKVATHDGRVAVMGVSKGGELALLVAATFPDLVGPVVAYTPSNVVWAGIDFTLPRGAMRSSWSLTGTPLPYVPYPEGVQMPYSERGFSGLPVYDRGLDNAAAVLEASIPVERATGPLLLMSGGDDRLWPAARMCHMVVERLRLHGRADAVSHLNYPDAGHVLFPYKSPSHSAAQPPFRFDFGGSREASATAHADAWPQVVAHLRQGADPA